MANRKKQDDDSTERDDTPDELGPVVPADGDVEPFEQVEAGPGVQPLEDSDIPDEGR